MPAAWQMLQKTLRASCKARQVVFVVVRFYLRKERGFIFPGDRECSIWANLGGDFGRFLSGSNAR